MWQNNKWRPYDSFPYWESIYNKYNVHNRLILGNEPSLTNVDEKLKSNNLQIPPSCLILVSDYRLTILF